MQRTMCHLWLALIDGIAAEAQIREA